MTIIEIDVATALELLRADGTVVLHAAEAGVEITLPVRVALDTPTTPTPRVRPAPPAAPKPKPAKTAPPPRCRGRRPSVEV